MASKLVIEHLPDFEVHIVREIRPLPYMHDSQQFISPNLGGFSTCDADGPSRKYPILDVTFRT